MHVRQRELLRLAAQRHGRLASCLDGSLGRWYQLGGIGLGFCRNAVWQTSNLTPQSTLQPTVIACLECLDNILCVLAVRGKSCRCGLPLSNT